MEPETETAITTTGILSCHITFLDKITFRRTDIPSGPLLSYPIVSYPLLFSPLLSSPILISPLLSAYMILNSEINALKQSADNTENTSAEQIVE
jgi:hypothetical protein